MGLVNEGSIAQYTGQLIDELTGANIALSSIVSLTLTLRDATTGTIINNRDTQNILNANNVTVSSTGLITWSVQGADNVIVNDNLDSELHEALFEGVYSTNKPVKHIFAYRVMNLVRG